MTTLCKLGQILDSDEISAPEWAALSEAVQDKVTWSSRALAAAVNETRFSIGSTTIKDHRNEVCGCFNDNSD